MRTKPKTKDTTPPTRLARLLEYINGFDIYTLVLVPLLLGMAFMAIGYFAYKYISHGNMLVVYNRVIGSIGFFIMGFAGIFQIIKRELLGPFKKSKFSAIMAVLNGILIVGLAWSLTIVLPLMSILGE
jgi:hypothetical protein